MFLQSSNQASRNRINFALRSIVDQILGLNRIDF